MGAFQLNLYLKSKGTFPKLSSGYSFIDFDTAVDLDQRSMIP